jgi:hypothetical protein
MRHPCPHGEPGELDHVWQVTFWTSVCSVAYADEKVPVLVVVREPQVSWNQLAV